ncbi:Folate-dependent protein for Fe/S cluster synthesis/repair in oxidative stress [Bathymodiolus thermophilus thioautotrophic gill symbiont]|uniref:CAF17-like 4Fe-4S cluster assembly/insertion protein YgfZ n=1 Tax=Bathymodiolus thermophilus thioautotrophic gill symbiont TaxID=2360 RepID=UPI0010B56E6C|nr:folate-binding protein YgfZ [Bathymodiolus thermophilus thioautotrophic gill symbiont]SGZ60025.1 Folate-dependent protein for Fe/S cluster synthesis/repair in oxidative stress [Bathymodiolus thermophilus thioautotrophic gill symbiont]
MIIRTPVLKVSGKDAQSFLQGQLSNEINKIVDGQWQLNAYCQHQGRIIALMWVQKQGDDFYLDFALDLKAVVQNRLKMFALNAAVVFDEVDCQEKVIEEAQVTLATSEKFIPQDLNLDIDEVGVSFTKGCYPGQEVVARVHYLGTPKRRLYQFECDFEVNPLDKLTLEDATKNVGTVLNQVKSRFFAVLKIAEKDKTIFINNQPVKLLELANFPS